MTTTVDLTQFISEAIEGKRDRFTNASDRIWGFAETRFDEFQSAEPAYGDAGIRRFHD